MVLSRTSVLDYLTLGQNPQSKPTFTLYQGHPYNGNGTSFRDWHPLHTSKHPGYRAASGQLQEHLDISKGPRSGEFPSTIQNRLTFSLRHENLSAHCTTSDTAAVDAWIHLDWRLTWKAHIRNKRKESDTVARRLHWLISRKSTLSSRLDL